MLKKDNICKMIILDEADIIIEEDNRIVAEIIQEIPLECYVMEDTS